MKSTQEEKIQLGHNIVRARKRKGMSQLKLAEALAARTDIEPESVRRSLVNHENGKFAPRLRTLEAIAEITDQPLSFFLGSPEVDTEDAPFPSAA